MRDSGCIDTALAVSRDFSGRSCLADVTESDSQLEANIAMDMRCMCGRSLQLLASSIIIAVVLAPA